MQAISDIDADEHQLTTTGDLAIDQGLATGFASAGRHAGNGEFEIESFTRQNLATELGLVEPAEKWDLASEAFTVQHGIGPELSDGLCHEHTWKRWATRKVASKER